LSAGFDNELKLRILMKDNKKAPGESMFSQRFFNIQYPATLA
jgi:hypothetical protein